MYSVSHVISMRRMVYMSLKYDMSSSRFVVASVGNDTGTGTKRDSSKKNVVEHKTAG